MKSGTVDPMAGKPSDRASSYERITRVFEDLNRQFFDGRIAKPKFQLNGRMRKAGSVDLLRWQMDISISYHDRYGWGLELTNTVAHEMIHLYLRTMGKPAGHNRRFRKMAEKVGCTLYSKSNKRPYRYVFGCPSCGRQYKTRKWMGDRYSCGFCSAGRFTRRYALKFQRTLR